MEDGKSERASLKEAFEAMSLDDKAAFLVHAAFSTAASALSEIGDRVDGLIRALGDDEDKDGETGSEPGEGASDEPGEPAGPAPSST